MECHDFMENFAFGLCMGNFALSVLCKVLMDMKYFELDFISETKHLGWGKVVKDLMKSGLGSFTVSHSKSLVSLMKSSLE